MPTAAAALGGLPLSRAEEHVDVRDLAGGVHPGICAASCEEPNRHAEHGRQRLVKHTGDGALPLLNRPAGEICSVVGDIEPQTDALANPP